MNKKINMMYFSATGTTRKVVSGITKKISENIDMDIVISEIDFTMPEIRKEPVCFTEEDIVIIGVPVYAGRVPNVLLNYLNSIVGS
ncbi:MAG: flavodoxin domain-containing protein, partial [Clostridium sp.]